MRASARQARQLVGELAKDQRLQPVPQEERKRKKKASCVSHQFGAHTFMAMAVLNLHAPRRGSCFSPKPPPFSFVLSLSLLQLLLTVLPLYTLVPFSFAASTTALPPCSTLSDVSSCASEEVVAPCVWHADNSSVQALTLACDLARGLPSSLPATCSSSPCGLAVEMASPAATTAETAAAATATLLGRFHTQGLTLTGQWSGAAVARALLGAPGLRTLVASGVGLAALPADLLHAVPALAELHLRERLGKKE